MKSNEQVIIPDFLNYSEDECVGFSQFGTLQTNYKVAHIPVYSSLHIYLRGNQNYMSSVRSFLRCGN